MFGVFLKETATDYQILVNVKPYRTDLRILSKEKYSKVSEIPVGVKVEFNESMIISAEYFDCSYCHMPEIPGNNCPSPAKNTVSATGKLIKVSLSSMILDLDSKLEYSMEISPHILFSFKEMSGLTF